MNVSHGYISFIESGKRGCSVDVLIALSNLFGVSIDYLVLGTATFTAPDSHPPGTAHRCAEKVCGVSSLGLFQADARFRYLPVLYRAYIRSWCFFRHRWHRAVRIPFRFLPKDPNDRPRFSRHRFLSVLQQKLPRLFLNPPDRSQLDIAALTTGFQLDARVLVVPAVADD